MTLEARKLNLISWMVQLQDETAIKNIEEYIKRLKKYVYEAQLKPMSKDELSKIIDEAEDDINAGRIYTNEEVFKYLENK